MWNWFFRNLRSFATALLLALIVWVSAVIADNPDETRAYPRPVQLELVGQDTNLVIIGNVPSQVNLTLRAPQSVWNELTATNGQVKCLLDLSGLDAGEHTIPVKVQINNRPVRVIEVSPTQIELTLEKLSTRSLPVELLLIGQPAIGYQLGDMESAPTQVVISGPESGIERVAHVQARIRVDGARTSIETETTLTAVDEQGLPVNNVNITPQKATLRLPISQQGGYRDIAVKVVVRGQVASGYRLTNISVSPPALTVFSGDKELVNALPGYVETEPLDLNQADGSIEARLKLALPAGVSVVGDQTVVVQVGINAIEGSLSLNNMHVEVVGLPEGLDVTIAPTTVDLILAGPLPLLDKLTPGDVRITVDLSGLAPGVHQIVPKVEILVDDIQVQSTNPVTVEVTLLNRAPGAVSTPTLTITPTPTPTPTPTQ